MRYADLLIFLGLVLLAAEYASGQLPKAALFSDNPTGLTSGGFISEAYKGLRAILPQDHIDVYLLDFGTILAAGFNSSSIFPSGAENASLIVCPGFEYGQAIITQFYQVTWAQMHPSIKFVIIDQLADTPQGQPLPNLLSVTFAEDEAGYIAGVGAAVVTKATGVRRVGAVCGLEIPPVVRWVTGFYLGVKRECPECLVKFDFLSTFGNMAAGRAYAHELAAAGVDVVFNVAGNAGAETLREAAQLGLWVIGTDSDVYDTLFESGTNASLNADRVLFSVQKGVSTAAEFAVRQLLNGTFEGGALTFRFENGGVQLLPCHESCNVIDPFQDPAMQAAQDSLLSGQKPAVDPATGALLYTLPPNLTPNANWTNVTPDFGPNATSASPLALINDGFGDKFLTFSGQTRAGQTWVYRISTRSWQSYTTPGAPLRARHSIVARPGTTQAYVFGGRNVATNQLTNDLYVWNYTTDQSGWHAQWDLLTPGGEGPPIARVNHAATFFPPDSMLVFGGLGISILGDLWRYDMAANTWEVLSLSGSITGRQSACMAVRADGLIVVYGGEDVVPKTLSELWTYDITAPSGEEWFLHEELIGVLPARKEAQCVFVNDTLWIFGGAADTQGLAPSGDVWLVHTAPNDASGGGQSRRQNAGARSLFTAERYASGQLPYNLTLHSLQHTLNPGQRDLFWIFSGANETSLYTQELFVYLYDPSVVPPEESDDDGLSDLAIALITVGVFLGLVIVVFVVVVLYLWRRRRYHYADTESAKEMETSRLTDLTALQSGNYKINYEDLRLIMPPIGKGGFAVVNKAKYKGTTVAVKTFIHQDNFDVAFNDWIKEVSQMMRLRHPNIVLLIGCTLNPLSIVTEFVERGSAADILKRDPSSLTPARKHVILADVARGMVYLHSQTPPIIHRDMKDTTHDETQSANVLITREWNAKIADFGISRPVASDLVMTKRVGTTRWMAPEVLKKEPYSEKSDVYSYGIMAWELWSNGKMPFDDIEFDSEIEQLVVSGTRPPIPEDTPATDKRLMLDCWQDDPALRPAFEQILDMLERECQGDLQRAGQTSSFAENRLDV